MKKILLFIVLTLSLLSATVSADSNTDENYFTIVLLEDQQVDVTATNGKMFNLLATLVDDEEGQVKLTINGEILPALEEDDTYTLVDGSLVEITAIDNLEVSITLWYDEVELDDDFDTVADDTKTYIGDDEDEYGIEVEALEDDDWQDTTSWDWGDYWNWDDEFYEALWDAAESFEELDEPATSVLCLRILDHQSQPHLFRIGKHGGQVTFQSLGMTEPAWACSDDDFIISFEDLHYFLNLMEEFEEGDSTMLRLKLAKGALLDDFQIWPSRFLDSSGIIFNDDFRERYCGFVKAHLSTLEADLAGVDECWEEADNDAEEEEATADELTVGSFQTEDLSTRDGILQTTISIENTQEEDLEDVTISLSLPHLGLIERAGPVDIEEGETFEHEFTLTTDGQTPPGYYPAKLAIEGADGTSMVEYREIWIE